MKKTISFKRKLAYLVVGLLLCISFVWGSGWYLSKPANLDIHMPSGFEQVVIGRTHASILKAQDNRRCALLMHGVKSNRTSMIDRALLFKQLGITSLLIDFQAHGETPGKQITFGVRESIDAENGLQYLRETAGCEKVLAIGQSMGGAAALLGKGPIAVDALVLESVYPTIEEAVKDRLEKRLGIMGGLSAPLLYQQIPLRTGIALNELHPIEKLKSVRAPIFIISGTHDRHTTAAETQRMFDSAMGKKYLWLVDGAAHEDLYKFSQDTYKEKLIRFMQQSFFIGSHQGI